jgi:hypothetical protein
MKYLRPIPDEVNLRPNTLVVTKWGDYSILDNKTGRTTIVRINVAEMNTGLDEEGYMHGKTMATIPMNIIETIYNYQGIKSACANYGELINENLLSFLISYYPKSRIPLLKKGFMTLRDKLSEIINKDLRFHTIEEFVTPESRKSFGRLFAEFIEDRNIYTHGSIVYRTNDNKILIHYVDRKHPRYAYSEINSDIMKSYEELYLHLSRTLHELTKRLNELNRLNQINNK